MSAAAQQLIDDVVSANHILYNEGVVDGFGHVTARHDKRPDRFLIARSMAPALVGAEDIMECDLEGNPHDPAGRRSYVERFIHSAIYAEVNAKLQSDAMRLGEINFLTRGEAASAAAMNDEHLERPWELWKLAAQRDRVRA